MTEGAGEWSLRTTQGNPRDGYHSRPLTEPSPTWTGVGRSYAWIPTPKDPA